MNLSGQRQRGANRGASPSWNAAKDVRTPPPSIAATGGNTAVKQARLWPASADRGRTCAVQTSPPRLSAWCQTAPGIPSHASAHQVCQMRLDDGLIDHCDCPDHQETTR